MSRCAVFTFLPQVHPWASKRRYSTPEGYRADRGVFMRLILSPFAPDSPTTRLPTLPTPTRHNAAADKPDATDARPHSSSRKFCKIPRAITHDPQALPMLSTRWPTVHVVRTAPVPVLSIVRLDVRLGYERIPVINVYTAPCYVDSTVIDSIPVARANIGC